MKDLVVLLMFVLSIHAATGHAVAAAGGAAAQDPAVVEAALDLDRPNRRLIQQELRNEGFHPGTPDGLFGPRTRAAIRDWQQSRGASPTGYLTGADVGLLRATTAQPPALSTASPPPEAIPAVGPSASSAAEPPPSSAEADSNPPPAPVADPVGPQSVAATNTEPSRPPPGPRNVQLPPEVMVDRHLIRMERLLANDEPAAALEAMNQILALQEEHRLVLDDDFYFHYARVAFAAGRTERAIASLNEYLAAAAREGDFYREALELLDAAEVRLEREAAAEVARRRAVRWPPGHVFRDCESCPEMVVLPGSVLALGRYELTVAEYRTFALATDGGARADCDGITADGNDSWRNPGFTQTDRHPVTCVSWNDAQAYLSWLRRMTGAAYRLPTAAEWSQASDGAQPGCYRQRTGRDGTCAVGTTAPTASVCPT